MINRGIVATLFSDKANVLYPPLQSKVAGWKKLPNEMEVLMEKHGQQRQFVWETMKVFNGKNMVF